MFSLWLCALQSVGPISTQIPHLLVEENRLRVLISRPLVAEEVALVGDLAGHWRVTGSRQSYLAASTQRELSNAHGFSDP